MHEESKVKLDSKDQFVKKQSLFNKISLKEEMKINNQRINSLESDSSGSEK